MKPQKTKSLTGSQVILKTLQDLGAELMLGYTGGSIMPTFDTLKEFPKIRFITARHEQGAGFIAQGYTRASGKIAPVMVTSGPGATNLITAVVDAQMDSVPMFCLTGQVATGVIGTDAFQEADVVGMMYTCTKYSYMPLSADELAVKITELYHIANHGRPGPVAIDIPKNIQLETTTKINAPKKLNLLGLKEVQKPKSTDIKKAVSLISKAKRPVALCGHGLIISESQKELVEFLEKALIPAAFTIHGLSSMPDKHPLHLGMMGMHGEVEANRAIQNADLLIALGMRFDDRVTGKLEEYATNAKVIHIEIDPSEIDKNVKADVAINSDLKAALTELTNNLEKVEKKQRQDFLYEIESNRQISQKAYSQIFEKGIGDNGQLLMSRIIHELSEFTEGMDNIVSDVGQHQMFAAKFYNYNRFNSWFNSGGSGTMGFGLPAAIGVKLARPDEEVWSINGDGGFQMNIQELGTILQENLNINILILNNGYLGMVKQWQNLFFKQNFAEVEMISPKFDQLAKAYGISYKKVEKVKDIRPALEWSKYETKATIVEFICDKSEHVFPMIASNMAFKEMIVDAKDAKERFGVN